MLKNKLFTTIVLLLVVSQIKTQDCNANITAFLAVTTQKEMGDEVALPAVVSLSTPATTDYDEAKMCGQVWKAQGGTCCAQDKLIARFEGLKTKLKKAAGKRKNVMEKAKDAMSKLTDFETKLAAKKTALTTQGNQTAKIANIDELIAAIAAIKTAGIPTAEELKENIANQAECIATIANLRAKFWCALCAKRGGTFDQVLGQGTVQIDLETCQSLVNKCAKNFGQLKKAARYDNVLRQFLKKFKGSSDSARAPRDNDSDGDLTAVVECAANPSTCAGNPSKRELFCGRIGINNDDPNVVGDSASGATTPDETLTRRLLSSKNQRILQGSDPIGAAEVGTTGPNYTTMQSGVTVTATDFNTESFAKNLVGGILFILALTTGFF